jgi:hypothetical protein
MCAVNAAPYTAQTSSKSSMLACSNYDACCCKHFLQRRTLAQAGQHGHVRGMAPQHSLHCRAAGSALLTRQQSQLWWADGPAICLLQREMAPSSAKNRSEVQQDCAALLARSRPRRAVCAVKHGQTWMSLRITWVLPRSGQHCTFALTDASRVCQRLDSHGSRWASTDENTDPTYDVMNSNSSCDGHLWRRSIRPAF